MEGAQKMKLNKALLLMVGILTVIALGAVAQSHSANLGLLVSNSSSLDAEEQAAYDFATDHGFVVTKVDPSMISNDPSILSNFDGFWAANNSTPSGFNSPTIMNALRSQLEGGKRMLITWYGQYLAGYLGLGTAYIGSSWYPAVSDHEYWVDKVTDHPLFNNLTPWRPPVGPPDDESKLLWYVTPGYVPGGPTINWSVTPTGLQYAHIWASYGWCGQSPDPTLQTQYGITGTCQRGVYVSSFNEVPIGSGSIIQHSPSMASGDYWHYGAMGFQMVENSLKYVCGGAPPHLPVPANIIVNATNIGQCFPDVGTVPAFEGWVDDAEGNGIANLPIHVFDPVKRDTSIAVTDAAGKFNYTSTAIADTNYGMYTYCFGDMRNPHVVGLNIHPKIQPNRYPTDLQLTQSYTMTPKWTELLSEPPRHVYPGEALNPENAFVSTTPRCFPITSDWTNATFEYSDDDFAAMRIAQQMANMNYDLETTAGWHSYQIGDRICQAKAERVFMTSPTSGYYTASDILVAGYHLGGLVMKLGEAGAHVASLGLVGAKVGANVSCDMICDNYAQHPESDWNRGWCNFCRESVKPIFVGFGVLQIAGEVWTRPTVPAGQTGTIHQVVDDVGLGLDIVSTGYEEYEWASGQNWTIYNINGEPVYGSYIVTPEGQTIPVRMWVKNDEGTYMTISGKCPFDLGVYDHLGHYVGIVQGTNSTVAEIPGSYYSGYNTEPQCVVILQPTGSYQIVIHGKKDTTFTLAVMIKRQDGEVLYERTIQGDCLLGSDEIFIINFVSDPNALTTTSPAIWYTLWQSQDSGSVGCIIGNLPAGYTVNNIFVTSIRMNETLSILDGSYHILPSYPGFEGEVIEVWFDRKLALQSLGEVEVGDQYPVIVSGQFTDGKKFYAQTMVKVEEGPGYASLSGLVKENTLIGLLGVNVDIYDSTGVLWMSVVTDDSGYYHIDSIPNGNYSISVVTPLGYQADQETKEFTINHVPVTVDFSLTKLAITPRQHSCAYWADQLCRALQNKPKDCTRANFSRFAGLINVHFNQNEINPVNFYAVPQPANQNDSLTVMKKILTLCNNQKEPFLKRFAKAELMALMLNVVSGKISQTQAISADDRTVSQAITYCDMLVNDEIDCPPGSPDCRSPLCRYIRADFILTFANLGLKVPKGLIPEDVIKIAYRIHNQQELPDGFALLQNYPNPFNPACNIEYSLPTDCQVTLSIYNILGQKVRVLVDEYQNAGFKTVSWDGKDDKGENVSSGIYFYRIKANGFEQTKRMVLTK
jgi:hypothetical protein